MMEIVEAYAVEDGYVSSADRDDCFGRLRPAQCFDCGQARPTWASLTLGIYVCLTCSGQHRALGAQVSFVRSLEMDRWRPAQLLRMLRAGNDALAAWMAQNGVRKGPPAQYAPLCRRYVDSLEGGMSRAPSAAAPARAPSAELPSLPAEVTPQPAAAVDDFDFDAAFNAAAAPEPVPASTVPASPVAPLTTATPAAASIAPPAEDISRFSTSKSISSAQFFGTGVDASAAPNHAVRIGTSMSSHEYFGGTRPPPPAWQPHAAALKEQARQGVEALIETGSGIFDKAKSWLQS